MYALYARRRKTPSWVLVSPVVLALVLMVALVEGSSGATPPKSTLSGSIRVLLPTSVQPAMERVMIPNFKRVYPNVKVETQYVVGGSAAHISTVTTQFQAGNAPDVVADFGGSGGASPSVTTLQQGNFLFNLNSQPWVKKYPAWLKPFANVKGKGPYTWISAVGFGVIIHNQDKFKSMNLTVPKTVDDLRRLCTTIKQRSPGSIPLSFAAANPTIAAYTATMFALGTVYAKNPYWNTQRANGQRTFANTAGWRDALQTFLDLKSSECFGPGVASDNAPQVISQMGSGQAVMALEISARLGGIEIAGPSNKYAMFPVPGPSEKLTRLFVYPGMALSVSAKSNNRAAALAFVNFLARPKQNDTLAKANGYQNLAPYNFDKGIWPSIYSLMKPLSSKKIVAPFFTWPSVASFNVLATGVQGLLTGQKTVDQVLGDMDSAWGK